MLRRVSDRSSGQMRVKKKILFSFQKNKETTRFLFKIAMFERQQERRVFITVTCILWTFLISGHVVAGVYLDQGIFALVANGMFAALLFSLSFASLASQECSRLINGQEMISGRSSLAYTAVGFLWTTNVILGCALVVGDPHNLWNWLQVVWYSTPALILVSFVLWLAYKQFPDYESPSQNQENNLFQV